MEGEFLQSHDKLHLTNKLRNYSPLYTTFAGSVVSDQRIESRPKFKVIFFLIGCVLHAFSEHSFCTIQCNTYWKVQKTEQTKEIIWATINITPATKNMKPQWKLLWMNTDWPSACFVLKGSITHMYRIHTYRNVFILISFQWSILQN